MISIGDELRRRGFTDAQAVYVTWNLAEAITAATVNGAARNKACAAVLAIVMRGRFRISDLDTLDALGIEACAGMADALEQTAEEVRELCEACLVFADAQTLMAWSIAVLRRHSANVVPFIPAARRAIPKQAVYEGQSQLI